MSQVSTPQPKLYTARDIERLDAQGHRYELVAGELLPISPTNFYHVQETMELAGEIWAFVRSHKLGVTFAAETGFRLSRNPDTVLAPDIAYVSKDRLAKLSKEGFVECAPDLVVETRSPSDSKREIAEKIQRWIDFGVPIVIDLYPKAARLTVNRPGHVPEVLGPQDTLRGYDVLVGFELPLQEILAVPEHLLKTHSGFGKLV